MTKVFCDKCETEIGDPKNAYTLTVKDYTADLCINCAGEVQNFVEAGN